MQYKLGRKVNHDTRSLNYPFDTTNLSIVDVEHKRLIPVLDQGDVGSCTGNAGIGVINTAPFVQAKIPYYSPDEAGALKLYGEAEKIDGGAGYPPEDQGSSGLSIAKALKNAGVISGYQHVFTLQDTLKALSMYSVLTGMNWYEDMFKPDSDGRVHPTGALAGGHEIQAYKIDVENGRIWFYNSWKNWGINGTFYLTWADFNTLLGQQGDVTVLLPLTPQPMKLTVTIERIKDDGKETQGILTANNNNAQFKCYTLELPWKNNETNVSCIPLGTYDVSYTFSSGILGWTYEIKNVTARTGIRIHSANYFSQLKGCIALGKDLVDINADKELDITSSKATIASFEAFMQKKPFTLIIL